MEPFWSLMDGKSSTQKATEVKDLYRSLYCLCGFIQVSGRRRSPIWLETVTLTPCFQPKFSHIHDNSCLFTCFRELLCVGYPVNGELPCVNLVQMHECSLCLWNSRTVMCLPPVSFKWMKFQFRANSPFKFQYLCATHLILYLHFYILG